MKLTCVGIGPCRCLVLRFRKANILLDCATPLHSALCAIGGPGRCNVPDPVGGAHPPYVGGEGASTAEELWGGDGCLHDLTPFLPLLACTEIHAALISSPEGLLALPYLLSLDLAAPPPGGGPEGGPPGGPAARQQPGVTHARTGGVGALAGGGGAGAWEASWGGEAGHHVGPIRGPIYATQAALDAAEQIAAERMAAEEALAAAARRRAAAAAATRDPAQVDDSTPAGEETVPAAAQATSEPCSASGMAPVGRGFPSSGGLGLALGPPNGGDVAGGAREATQEALLAGSCWRRRADWRAVRHVLDRVRPLRYGQVVPLDSYELVAAPYPSGSGFGHAVWQIRDGTERCRTVLYMPHVAPAHAFAPPLPLDLLGGPDALILGPDMLQPPAAAPAPAPLSPAAAHAPAPASAPLPTAAVAQSVQGLTAPPQPTAHAQQPVPPPRAPQLQPQPPPGPRPPLLLVKEAVLGALAAGGSVLIPVSASGEAWELIEALAAALASAGDLLAGAGPGPGSAGAAPGPSGSAPGSQAGPSGRGPLGPGNAARAAGAGTGAGGRGGEPGSGPGPPPLLYVGPRARASLALASVSLESLAPQRRAAVYSGPAPPFAFDALLRSGRLVAASSLRDAAARRCLDGPAVVLAAAESLLHPGGAAHELLLRFGPDPRSALVLPYAAPPAALRGIRRLYDSAVRTAPAAVDTATGAAGPSGAAGQAAPPPMRCRVVVAGGGGGLAPAVALDLVRRLQPRQLLLSGRDLDLLTRTQQQQQQQPQPQPQAPGGSGTGPLARDAVVPYAWLSLVRTTLPRNVAAAQVSTDLLQRLTWMPAGPGLQLARLTCLLTFRDGDWHADPVPGSAASADAVAAAAALAVRGAVAADQLLLAPAPAAAAAAAAASASAPAPGGSTAEAGAGPAATQPLSLTRLLESLAAKGVRQVEVEAAEGEAATCVRLPGTDAHLLLRPAGAHIHTACPVLRQALTEAVMEQLTVI
ncbi:hypothetical protein HYH03_003575 [Edaphochlamys debaryana]|uniref:Beta-Casp domain-containing protein n=1 Tax=Edaphochlamys debaryana TaxID=47281 RepID=A0A835YAV0_9CHLO|nr:hypothetical protein HYH03_003575 [Edaphochlamys debaryana]|eukprot:KAG2498314.1 hypothetical protein HYH03_003575 [Edaphochlamys debaryana]